MYIKYYYDKEKLHKKFAIRKKFYQKHFYILF